MEDQGKKNKSECESLEEDSNQAHSKHFEGLSVDEKRAVELISNILIKFLLDENNF